MSDYQQYNKDFQWCGLDAVRVDDRLIEDIIYQLSKAENRYHYYQEPHERYIQAHRNCAAVFYYYGK